MIDSDSAKQLITPHTETYAHTGAELCTVTCTVNKAAVVGCFDLWKTNVPLKSETAKSNRRFLCPLSRFPENVIKIHCLWIIIVIFYIGY